MWRNGERFELEGNYDPLCGKMSEKGDEPVAIPELHPDFVDLPNLSLAEKKYASMVKMLDDHVGLIMAELKQLGLDD